MGVSWQEGMDLAEREAWRTKGKEYRNWFVYGKRLTPPLLALAALGGLGWAAHWIWTRATGALSGDLHVPGGATVFVAVLLALGSFLALRGRSGTIRSTGAIALTVLVVLVVWAAFILFLIGAVG